jgi:enoyl-CoA hydratase/3-hydroxyacyl-CoA dehydrogenase
MNIREIQRVCFVGAGAMGCFNSLKAAISGYEVVLYDVDESMLQQVASRHWELAAFLVGSGYCVAEDISPALARVSLAQDLVMAVEQADLVSESVFERLDIKREVHAELDRVCPAHTILTSNSSYLCLSDFENVVARGDRIAALHSYMASPLIDIVGGPRTSDTTIEILRRYVLSMHAVPLVLKKEYPGYVLNALLGAVLTTAKYLLIHCGASCEAVDRAWMLRRSALMGPLGILDLIGLGPVYDYWHSRDDEGPIPGLRPQVLELLRPMVERGDLGMRCDRGFYSYPDPAYQHPGFLQEEADRDDLYLPLVLALMGSALLVAASDVAEPADIDQAWRVGMSLDIGPFELLKEMGHAEFQRLFSGHVAAGRFDPDKAQLAEDYLDQL